MIGWLRGDVRSVSPIGELIVDVGGVGYLVHVPSRTTSTLKVGTDIELFVHTNVRDDAIVLYGFFTTDEKDTFSFLLATPGVGPTTAMGALSAMTPSELAAAIAAEDVATLAKIPGIGKKTASRLVLELNGKLPSLDAPTERQVEESMSSDVAVALRQLGYSAGEIRDALAGVDLPDDDAGALRVALRQLGRQ